MESDQRDKATNRLYVVVLSMAGVVALLVAVVYIAAIVLFFTPPSAESVSDHGPLDPHSLDDLIRESGLAAQLENGELSDDSSYIVGTFAFGDPPDPRSTDPWPPEAEGFRDYGYEIFRMGLALVTDTGERIPDFFEGIPGAAANNSVVGDGHAVLEVAIGAQFRAFEGDERLQAFKSDFELEREQKHRLTFKEFRGHTYFLKDLPPGKAYVWFQTPIDLNRITQIPAVVRFPSREGEIRRHDFRIGVFRYFIFF